MTVKIVGGKIPPKEHAKLKIEDEMDYMFERLMFARINFPLKDIRRDCLFLPEDMGPMWAHIPHQDTGISYFPPDAIDDVGVVWPVEVGTIFHSRDNPEWGNSLQCNYFQTVPAAKLRGRYRFVSKYNIGWGGGVLTADGGWHPLLEYGAWHFNRWRRAQRVRYDDAFLKNVPNTGGAPISQYRAFGDDDIGKRCAIGQSMALTYRYEWGAQFSIGPSVRIIVPTTPKGVLELFNDRNKPADRDRRAALRHWVSQHRRRKVSRDGFVGVRKHLRGETSFSWRGFDVVIRPSQFDLDQSSAGRLPQT